MIRRLQSFAFNRSPYERPNQKWVCGRAADGCPCRIGPDRRGRCRAQAECRPRREGERWVCTRPTTAGGACAEGPRPDGSCAHPIPPCQPVRSVRAKRGLAARWAAVVAIGLMVLALHGPDVAGWLSPGALTAHHAELGDCAGCHQDFEAGPSGWLHAALGGVPPADAGDSKQCLSCHELGERPLAPHGAPEKMLAASTEDQQAERRTNVRPIGLNMAGRVFPEPDQTAGGTACANCHSEHRGRDASLTAMSDARCQSCHTLKFAAFTAGHPQFDSYPYDRRTRLNFDHVGHLRKHFPESDEAAVPERCADCHTPDARGEQMLVKGFETTCAACHAGEIRGEGIAGSAGLPVIAVPGLDVPSLREAGAQIGGWPELSDRELTPFMRAVFAGDPELEEALARFRELDPLDLREAAPEDIAAVEQIAWATKELLYDLLADGPAALRPALSRAFGNEIGADGARDLLGGLPLAGVRSAQAEWFPDLAREVARHRAGKPVPMPASEFGAPAADGEDSDEAAAGGSQDSILGGDEAEGGDLLGGSEDEAAGGQDDILSEDPDGGDILGGEDSGSGDGDILSEEPSGGDLLGGDGGGGVDAAGQGDILSEEPEGGDLLGGDSGDGADAADGGDDILTEMPEGGDLTGSADEPAAGGDDILSSQPEEGDLMGDSSESSDILSGDEAAGGGDLLGGGSGDESAQAESGEAAVEASLPEPNPETWSRLGGWYRDYFALNYRPRGHADRFLQRWLELAGGAMAGDARALAAPIFDRLAADDAPGKCVKCHSVDAGADGALAINWRGKQPEMGVQHFTRFAHGPHFTLLNEDEGCATCHAFDRDADYTAAFDDRDPTSFQSNFQPIGRGTCGDCHVDERAGDACTQCHAYHVGRVASDTVPTRMETMDVADSER